MAGFSVCVNRARPRMSSGPARYRFFLLPLYHGSKIRAVHTLRTPRAHLPLTVCNGCAADACGATSLLDRTTNNKALSPVWPWVNAPCIKGELASIAARQYACVSASRNRRSPWSRGRGCRVAPTAINRWPCASLSSQLHRRTACLPPSRWRRPT